MRPDSVADDFATTEEVRPLVAAPVGKAMRSGKDRRARVRSIGPARTRGDARRAALALAACLFLMAGLSGPAFAHTAERGFVLTLPTGL